MLFVGRKTSERLRDMAIFTIGDLACANLAALKRTFGINGEKMWRAANGIDDDPVMKNGEERVVKSVGHGTTTLRDMRSLEDVDKVAVYLCEMIATRLRRYGLTASVVAVDMRSANDLSHFSRQTSVQQTATASALHDAAMRLVRKNWDGSPLRTLSVYTSGLAPCAAVEQASIFDEVDDKKANLEFALDKIRKKFGFYSIKKAALVGNDLVCDKFAGEDDLLPFHRG